MKKAKFIIILSLIILFYLIFKNNILLVFAQSEVNNVLSYPLSYTNYYADAQNENKLHFNQNILLPEALFFSNEGKTYKLDSLLAKPEIIADVGGKLSNKYGLIAYTKKKENEWGIYPEIYIYDINKKEIYTEINLEDDGISKFVAAWSPNDNFIILQNEAQALGTEKAYFYDVRTKKLELSLDLYTYGIHWIDSNQFIYFKRTDKSIDINVFDIQEMISNKLGSFDDIGYIYPHINNTYILNSKLQISVSNFVQVPSETVAIKYEEIKRYFEFDMYNRVFTNLDSQEFLENQILIEMHNDNIDNYRIIINKKYDEEKYLINISPKLTTLDQSFLIVDLKTHEINKLII